MNKNIKVVEEYRHVLSEGSTHITLMVNDMELSIYVDNSGELTITSSGHMIDVRPKASNSITLIRRGH